MYAKKLADFAQQPDQLRALGRGEGRGELGANEIDLSPAFLDLTATEGSELGAHTAPVGRVIHAAHQALRLQSVNELCNVRSGATLRCGKRAEADGSLGIPEVLEDLVFRVGKADPAKGFGNAPVQLIRRCEKRKERRTRFDGRGVL